MPMFQVYLSDIMVRRLDAMAIEAGKEDWKREVLIENLVEEAIIHGTPAKFENEEGA